MDQPAPTKRISPKLDAPQVSLLGEVNEVMVETLVAGLREASQDDGELVIEITTGGGDAELARRLVLEVEEARRRMPKRRLIFLGKTQVHSAGVTLMSAFPCRDRYLTADTILLIHSRQLEATIAISGPMRTSLPEVEALKQQIELGIRLEQENFRRLIKDCDIGLEEISEKAVNGWYLPAEEAVRRGLVAGAI